MKRFFITLATLSLLFAAGCKRDEPVEPTRDVELTFKPTDISQVEPEAIKKLLKSKNAATIRTIYLVPKENEWAGFSQDFITAYRNLFEPVFELSPKIKGRGDFNFMRGEASKVPADSLWFIERGWTINKRFIDNQ